AEQLDGARVFEQGGGNDLDGDDPPHRRVHRLVDAAHAAPAERVQEPVLPQDQPPELPGEESPGLEPGQGALRDQGAGQVRGPVAVREAGGAVVQFLLREEATPPQVLQERVPVHGRGRAWPPGPALLVRAILECRRPGWWPRRPGDSSVLLSESRTDS